MQKTVMQKPVMQEAAHSPSPAPWWRHGHVWLVLAGPLVVIVAGFVTLWLALRSPDALVTEDYYRKGIEINRTLELHDRAHLPAVQGRNHAATPAK